MGVQGQPCTGAPWAVPEQMPEGPTTSQQGRTVARPSLTPAFAEPHVPVVPAGSRERASSTGQAPLQAQRSDAEPRMALAGAYSSLWDVSPNGKHQGVVRICHKYLRARTSIS